MTDITIRKMVVEDIDAVLEVDQLSFAVPWSRDIFIQELTVNRFSHYFVVEMDEEIIAYAGMWVIIDEAQITNIAVTPACRGKKIGERLFGYMLSLAMRFGVEQLSLEVRKSNIAAQKMYEKFGLVPGGVRKNYYTDNQEDGIVMWVNFNEAK